MLIDTDAGVDDALAIVLALASPDIEVEAITTVAGNVGVDQATRNVFTILETVTPDRMPPVAKGAAAPLKRALETASHVHGEDGLGNITSLPKYPLPKGQPVPGSAAKLIVETARCVRKDLTIVTIGPLTNVANAISLDAASMRGVGEIIIMGGAFRVYGNTSIFSEFNIHVDPEAASIVAEFDVPKTFVPLDVTEQVRLMRSDLEARLAYSSSSLSEFVRDVSAFYMDFHRDNDGFDGCFMHDPAAMALAMDPSLGQYVPAEVHVECEGRFTSGMTVADLRPEKAGRYRPNAKVCVGTEAERVIEVFFSTLGA